MWSICGAIRFSMLLLFFALLSNTAHSQQLGAQRDDFIRVVSQEFAGLARTDRVLALVVDGVSDAEIRRDLRAFGAREVGRFGARSRGRILEPIELQVESLSDDERRNELGDALRELSECGSFSVVEPDWLVSIQEAPIDSGLVNGELWGLRNDGTNGGVAGVDISAIEAWETTAGSPEVLVGVVDSGVRYTHEDLVSNLWRNPGEIADNGLDDDGNGWVDDIFGINTIANTGDPWDDNGHGTHVTGTLVAQANGGGPAVGVAWRSRVIALKFLNENGRGSVSDAITCIEYGLSQGVRIFNNSWGGAPFSAALREAIRAANDKGALFVVAAGNSARSNERQPQYPANYDAPNVISVGALNRDGTIARFSNFGVTTVDIAAPGSDIFSTEAAGDDAYGLRSGTSMAAPHVSGVAALVWADHPRSSVDETRWRILNTARRTENALGLFGASGWVDANAALSVVEDAEIELSINYEAYPLPGGAEADVYVTVSDFLPILGGSVEARIGKGPWTELMDQGRAPDMYQDDGVYTGALAIPNESEKARLYARFSLNGEALGAIEREVAIQPMPLGIQLATRDYRLDSGEETIELSGDSLTETLAVGENGSVFATYTSDRGVIVSRSLDHGRSFTRRSILSPDRAAASIAVSPDGSTIVTAWVSLDGLVTVCQSVDGGNVYSIPEVVDTSRSARSFARAMIHDGLVFVLEGDGSRLWSAPVDRGFEAEWLTTPIDTGATTGGLFVSERDGSLWVFTVDPFLRLFVSDDMGRSFRRFALSADASTGPLVVVDPDVSKVYGDSSPKVLIAGSAAQAFEINLNSGDLTAIPLKSFPIQRSVAVDRWERIFDGFYEDSSIHFRVMGNRDGGFSSSAFVGAGSIYSLAPSGDGTGLVTLRQSEDRVSVSRFDLAALSLGASELDFVGLAGGSASANVSLENHGDDPLNIDISTSESWLSVSPTSLILSPGERRTIKTLVSEAPDSDVASKGTITLISDERVSSERFIDVVFWRRAEFEDTRLAEVVAGKIGVSQERLRRQDLMELESLDATDSGIQSLDGLQFATELRSLRVGHNQISSLIPIAHLANLESLTLDENPIESIGPLSSLVNLKSLLISAAALEDISSLETLTQLELLSLENNKIESVSPLSALTRLRRLFLNGNNISSVEEIGVLPDLVELGLRENQLGSLDGLETSEGLRLLDVSRNQLANIDAIQELKGLETVRLADNLLEFIPRLQGFGDLKYLDLARNRLNSLEGLVELASLVELDLGSNDLGSLQGIQALGQLELLWLQNNRIFDPSPLGGLGKLRDRAEPVVSEDEPFQFFWEGLRLENNLIPLRMDSNEALLRTMAAREGLSVNYALQRSALKTAPTTPVLAAAPGEEGDTYFTVENRSDFAFAFEWGTSAPWLSVHPHSGVLEGGATREFLAHSGIEAPILEGDESANLEFLNPRAPLEPIGITVSPMALFESDELEEALRERVSVYRNTLSAANVRGVRRLAVRSAGIQSLKGLEWAVGMEALNLAENSIVDVSPLSGLVALKALNLGGNRVARVDGLQALSELRWLDISENEIEDLGALGQLRSLQTLIAGRNRIESLEALRGLSGLTELRVERNRIDSLEPLDSTESLELLDVSFNQLGSLFGLEKAERLERLIAANNRIETISQLSGLVALESLSIRDNGIVDLTPLSALVDLSALDVGGNSVSDITPLAELSGLRTLNGERNQIQDVAALGALRELVELNLRQNQIEDLSPLDGLEALEKVNLQRNSLVSLEGVEGWRSLHFLNAGENAISSIEPLSELTGLESLILNRNRIASISGLRDLSALKHLDVADNIVRDIGEVAMLPELLELDVGANRVDRLPMRWREGEFAAVWLHENRLDSLVGLEGLRLKTGQASDLVIGEGEPHSERYPRLRIEGNYLDWTPSTEDRSRLEDVALERGVGAEWKSQKVPSAVVVGSRLAAPGSEFLVAFRGWLAEEVNRVALDVHWDISALRFEGIHFENDERANAWEVSTDDAALGTLGWRSVRMDPERLARLNDGRSWFAIRFTVLSPEGASTRVRVTRGTTGLTLDADGFEIPSEVELGVISVRERMPVEGRVSFYDIDRPIANVEIRWGDGDDQRVFSDVLGDFRLEIPLERPARFELYPPTDISTLKGVDVRDVILHSRLRESEPSALARGTALAADLDGDGDVDSEDTRLLESLALGAFQERPSMLWRFTPDLDGDRTLGAEPIGRFDYDGSGTLPDKLDWLLIRVGDLNGDAAP